jgi:hypothetical protein
LCWSAPGGCYREAKCLSIAWTLHHFSSRACRAGRPVEKEPKVAVRTSEHVRRLSRHIEVHQVSANRAGDEARLTSVVWVNRAMRRGWSEGGLQDRPRRSLYRLPCFDSSDAASWPPMRPWSSSRHSPRISSSPLRIVDASQTLDLAIATVRLGTPVLRVQDDCPHCVHRPGSAETVGFRFWSAPEGQGAPAPLRVRRWRDIPVLRFATRRLSLQPLRSKGLYHAVETWSFRPPVDGRVNVCVDAAVVSWSS